MDEPDKFSESATTPDVLESVSDEQLRTFLIQTARGRAMVDEVIYSRLCIHGVRVLIVLHRDGVLAVYGDNFLRVHFSNSPESVLDVMPELPEKFEELVWPNATDEGPGKVAEVDLKVRFQIVPESLQADNIETIERCAAIPELAAALEFERNAELLNDVE